MIKSGTFLLVMLAVLTAAVFNSCSDDAVEPQPDLITFPDGPFEFFDSLSEYGFFSGEMSDLEPHEQVFPYELSTTLFSDYTIKHRFAWMPGGTSMNYRTGDVVDFPPGTIIIKNFSSLDESDNEIRLETRMLLLDPYDNKWRVMNYIWNEAQTEATLTTEGADINIRVKNSMGDVVNTPYNIPGTFACIQCHVNNDVTLPIGPRIRSMNFTPAGHTTNQLDLWASQGRLAGLPSTGAPVLPDWLDEDNFTLDERARAYLDINCAHCHREGGKGASTSLFLDFSESDSTHLGFYKYPLAAGPGTGGLTYDIVPGNADESILYYRMNSDVPGVVMPEIARAVIHEEGVVLIREWIDSF